MKRTFALVLAMVLLVVLTVGATLAYLTDDTDEVTNTFTVGNVTIELDEDAGEANDYEFQMIPGSVIAKDPKVTVQTGSEDCWVFVEITDNATNYLDWDVAEGWTLVTGEQNVYYYEDVLSAGDVQYILAGDNDNANGIVTVKDTVTGITEGDEVTLSFIAYAIQAENLDNADDAWAALQG